MIGRIVRTEWRQMAADRSLPAVALLLGAALFYGAWNGADWAEVQRQRRDELRADYDARIADLRKQLADIAAGGRPASSFRDPRSAAVVGGRFAAEYAVQPSAPLAALAVGQSDLLPGYYKVALDSRQMLFAGEELENPANLLAGRFDVAFVVVFLYPLAILALGYGLLSADKEQGILALTLSQPISLAKLAGAKALARGLAAFALTAVLTLAAAVAAGVDLSAPGVWAALAPWFAAVAAYGAFWFAAAAAVNSLGGSSATNALALAGLWLALALVAPAALSLAATALYPTPSRVETIQAMREASGEMQAKASQTLSQYYEDHPELRPEGEVDLNDFNARRYAVEREVEGALAPFSERFERQIASRQALIERLRYLSPAILVQETLSELAGTGYRRHERFRASVEEFFVARKEYFLARVFRREAFTGEEIERIPRYAYPAEPAAATGAWRDVLALMGQTVLVAGLALVGLRRYPIV